MAAREKIRDFGETLWWRVWGGSTWGGGRGRSRVHAPLSALRSPLAPNPSAARRAARARARRAAVGPHVGGGAGRATHPGSSAGAEGPGRAGGPAARAESARVRGGGRLFVSEENNKRAPTRSGRSGWAGPSAEQRLNRLLREERDSRARARGRPGRWAPRASVSAGRAGAQCIAGLGGGAPRAAAARAAAIRVAAARRGAGSGGGGTAVQAGSRAAARHAKQGAPLSPRTARPAARRPTGARARCGGGNSSGSSAGFSRPRPKQPTRSHPPASPDTPKTTPPLEPAPKDPANDPANKNRARNSPSPRAATSVAIMIGCFPDLNSASTQSRSFCCLSPWIESAG